MKKSIENEAIRGKIHAAGAPRDVKITDEMVQAGFDVLATSGISDDYPEADKLVVAEIYAAMRHAAFAHRAVRAHKKGKTKSPPRQMSTSMRNH